MNPGIIRRLAAGAAVVVVALSAAWLAVPGAHAGSTRHRQAAAPAGCRPPARASGRESLAWWARHHHSTVNEVLTVTYVCGGGYAIRFDDYINGRSMFRWMPRGVPLWTLGYELYWRDAATVARNVCKVARC